MIAGKLKIKLFQSTLPREERRVRAFIFIWIIAFQSTLPREERPDRATRSAWFSLFQSTLPREERPQFDRMLDRQINFNPRSHERSDYDSSASFFICLNFNPRSHERSDEYDASPCNAFSAISIHAPTRGATAILHKKFVYFYTIPTINI